MFLIYFKVYYFIGSILILTVTVQWYSKTQFSVTWGKMFAYYAGILSAIILYMPDDGF